MTNHLERDFERLCVESDSGAREAEVETSYTPAPDGIVGAILRSEPEEPFSPYGPCHENTVAVFGSRELIREQIVDSMSENLLVSMNRLLVYRILRAVWSRTVHKKSALSEKEVVDAFAELMGGCSVKPSSVFMSGAARVLHYEKFVSVEEDPIVWPPMKRIEMFYKCPIYRFGASQHSDVIILGGCIDSESIPLWLSGTPVLRIRKIDSPYKPGKDMVRVDYVVNMVLEVRRPEALAMYWDSPEQEGCTHSRILPYSPLAKPLDNRP